jgi:hypothetical protein
MHAWENLVHLLAHVEGVAASESGLLAIGAEADHGGIFVERGRICWAVARGMGRRLHELLQAHATDRTTTDFNAIYQRCRANGTLLGETLVEEGHITARELEVSLRQHSAESLLALCHEELDEPVWRSRGERGYEPRFTFRPVDVLLDVMALRWPDIHGAARSELLRFDAPGRIGAAFHGSEVAMPIAGFGQMTVVELWNLGQWAKQLTQASRELGAATSLALATSALGWTVVSWWRRDVLYAVACADRRSLAEIFMLVGDSP